MNDADDRPPSTRKGSVCLDLAAARECDSPIANAMRPLADRALEALAAEAPLSGEVRARLVRDDEMAALHERHSGISGTTDVLTFDLRESSSDPLDVDIVLCIDEAARESQARSIPLEQELTLYLLHGVLHTLGHDDHDEDAYRAMHEREDRILSAAGLGPVFSTPRSGAGDAP